MKYVWLAPDEYAPLDISYCDFLASRLELRRLWKLERKKEIQAELDEASAIAIPEGSKLKWSDALGKMVWE